MSDDRPLEDPAQAIGRIDNALRDLEAQILARMAKRPTGDIEETIRDTAKPGTLICNGQLVSRTTYAALWAWVQANNRVQTGLFTNGDGSTTFGLPDWRGRVMRGTPSGEAVGLLTGADTKTIAITNLPAHDHNVSGSTGSDSHSHSGTTGGSGGNHGDHNTGTFNAASGGVSLYTASGPFGNAAHEHGFTTGSDAHTHTLSITEASVGSGTAFDVRQASFNGQWLVWC